MIYLLTLLINDAWRACQFRRVKAAGARPGRPGTHFQFSGCCTGSLHRRGHRVKMPAVSIWKLVMKLRRIRTAYPFRSLTAVFANWLASALSSRGTCEIEKLRARASLRQVQCREYRRELRQMYSPRIWRTTTSESE